MRWMALIMAAALSVTAASAQDTPPSAQDEGTMTKAQAKALSSSELFARTVAILSEGYSGRIYGANEGYDDALLKDVWLTKPMVPVAPGLCMGEYLAVSFKNPDLPAGVDYPVKPDQIRPGERFAYAGRPHYFPHYSEREEEATKATDCSGVHWPDGDANFGINDYDVIANRGLPLLAEALDEFAQHGSKLKVSCYHASCRDPRALFAAFSDSFSTSMISWMQSCTTGPFPAEEDLVCLIVSLPHKSGKPWGGCSWWLRIDRPDGRAGRRLEAIFSRNDCFSGDETSVQKPQKQASAAGASAPLGASASSRREDWRASRSPLGAGY